MEAFLQHSVQERKEKQKIKRPKSNRIEVDTMFTKLGKQISQLGLAFVDKKCDELLETKLEGKVSSQPAHAR